MDELFFELIRVAIGSADSLSHTPSNNEWKTLFDMARKQSLVGVCFAGLQRLVADEDEGFARIGMNEILYLTWMGMAAKIQQKNLTVDAQCVALQKRLSADDLRSCILKGQGVASLYSEQLHGLRQSGDIDVWILPNEGESANEHIARVVKYAKGFNPESHFSGKHIDLSAFDDTEVELHVTPGKMNSPWHNKRLQKWFAGSIGAFVNKNGLMVPDSAFNIVYLLLHCYDHLLFEGVGLRQVMDYYWTLYNYPVKGEDLRKTLSSLGLKRFASAMMWVQKEVFGIEEKYMICEPNEKEGRFLLNEIMTGGNFGKYGKDGVMEGHTKGKVTFFMARMKRNWRFLTHYPSEIIWSPYAMLSHYFWKRSMNNKI